MFMKKLLILCLVIFLLAVAFELPSNITGFALKVTSTVLTIAKEILKSVLMTIANMLWYLEQLSVFIISPKIESRDYKINNSENVWKI